MLNIDAVSIDLELPFEAIATPAAELSLDAASKADITRRAIAQAMAALAKAGGRITQGAIASHPEIARPVDVSQGWVSLCPNATEEVRP
jgi:hypothetical protein